MRKTLTALVAIVFAWPVSAAEPVDQARSALGVLKASCYRCHGQDGLHEGNLHDVLDVAALGDKKFVVAGDAEHSRLLVRIRKGQMPPPDEHPRPMPADIEILKTWIDAGAQAPPSTGPPAPPDNVEINRLLLADLERLDRRSRRFQRYFSLVPLARAGANEPALRSYRAGLSKLVNSLSWHPRIARLHQADPAGLLLRVDLRDVLWDAVLWNRIVAEYPYGVIDDSGAFRAVAAAAATRLPVVRADWFLATASRPPLYHDLLQLPTTAGELERQLRLDAAVDIQQERVARAGFTGSGVSRNNRLIERHDALNGAYWRTYDFEAVPQNLVERQNLRPDRRNLFAFPLGPGQIDGTFQHAGGEIIFHLPNGLLGFMLVDANNRRIDKAPTAIVSDPRRPDRAVEPGVSCMSCHLTGIQPKTDQIRANVARNPSAFSKTDAELVRALYPPDTVMKKLMDEDAERFRRAVEQCGCKVTEADPVSAAALRYEADLGVRTAAAEVGLSPDEFRRRLANQPLAQGLGALGVDGGTVHRHVFQQSFGDLVKDLRLGTLVQPSLVTGGLPDNTGELDPLEGPTAQTNAAAFLPDRRAVLLASADRSLRLVEVASGRELRRFVGHATSVWSVAVAPDGRQVLSGSLDGSVRLWDIATGQELRRLEGHAGLVSAAAFAADGKTAVTGGFDHAMIVWDLESGRELRRVESLASVVHCLALDPDGKRALAGGDPAVFLIDLGTARIVKKFKGHSQAVTALAWAADGQHFVSGSDDGTARLWDAESGQEVRAIRGHSGGVKAVLCAGDGKRIITGDGAGVVRQWNADGTGDPDQKAEHSAAIVRLEMANDGRGYLSVGRDGTVRARSGSAADPRTTPPPPPKTAIENRPAETVLKPVTIASFGGTLAHPALSPNGRWLYVLNRTDSRLLRLDAATLRTTATWDAPKGPETFALAPDGQTIYLVNAESRSGTLHVLNAKTLEPLRSISLPSPPYDLAAGPKGLVFISGGGSGWSDLRVIDVERGTVIATWGGAWARSLVALTPDGTRLLASTQGVSPGRLEALPLPTPLTDKPAAYPANVDAPVGGPIVISPDGQYVLCSTGTVLRLSATRADDLQLAARIEPFLAACVAPDRHAVLTLTDDGSLHVFDYPLFKPRATCRFAGTAHGMTLDASAGRLYVTGVAAQTLRDQPRARALGDVMVFDVRELIGGNQ